MICEENYLRSGMQTNHWAYTLGRAAALHRLGRIEECESALRRAWEILSHGWYCEKDGTNDFARNPGYYLPEFEKIVREYGLTDILPPEIRAEIEKY